jgi:hypothetical protein
MIQNLTDSPKVLKNTSPKDDGSFITQHLQQSSYKKKQYLLDAIPRSSDRLPAILLPLDFQPTSYSVIIGRGKGYKKAFGNQRLRVLANLSLPKYSGAKCKIEKSLVVTSIVDTIRECCPSNGAFVKYHDGRWWEVDDPTAREKVGYVFRDLLHDKYRSSSKSKVARRKKLLKEQEEVDSPTTKPGYEEDDCSVSDKSDTASATSGEAHREKVTSTQSEKRTTPNSKISCSIVEWGICESDRTKKHQRPIRQSSAVWKAIVGDDCKLPSNEKRGTYLTYNEDFDLTDLLTCPLLKF